MPQKGLTEFPPIQPAETQIRLDSNQISSIPSTLGQFRQLQILRLRNNKIESLPGEIGNLNALTQLLLSNNLITKLPNEIGGLVSLTDLRIENNQLTELPKEIGNLPNLTHLFLDNNKLSYFPPEIKNLTKLVHLSVTGNNLPLPPDYNPLNPLQTINFVLNNQTYKGNVESLITKKAFYFVNAKKDSVVGKYISLVKEFSKNNNVEFIEVKSESDITLETNVVFLICPIDSHPDPNLVERLSNLCRDKNLRFFIFCQDKFIENDFESANLDSWKEFQTTSTNLAVYFTNEYTAYSTYEQLQNIIFEALKQHKPNIRFKKLKLINIGHFSQIEIDFDKDITCLVGENGCGKSTILKALAVTGSNFRKIDVKSLKSFLKILEYSDNNITYKDGSIRLDYTIDGDSFTNTINVVPKDNGNDIIFTFEEDSQIIYNEYNLKSLIVGFPQDRGSESGERQDSLQNKKSQPHVDDLIPLINGREDFRLKSFTGWIAGLYFDSIQKEKVSGIEKSEEFLISSAFEIISKITKKDIRFKTVKKIDPPEVWVSTQDAPNGIPMNLISQGFKIVIGWVGYLMQRFVDTFPLSNPLSAYKENAIVIIDEVDISMHPIWQVSFIEILKDVFQNTQFVISTHDPIIIGGLLKNQVRVLKEKDGQTTVFEPDFDPKGLGVAGILTSELFGLKSTLDNKTLHRLNRRNELLERQESDQITPEERAELNEIFHYLNSLGINTTDRDPLYQKFIVALSKRDEFKVETYTPDELNSQNEIAMEVLNEILKEKEEEK